MRIRVLLICCFLLLVSGHSHGQDSHPPLISGHYSNRPLKEVLAELENNFKVKFSFLDQAVQNKYVTAKLKGLPLSNALSLILEGTTLAYEVFDPQNVVVFKRPVQETYSIQGRVVEKHSGAGIPFANVIIPTLRRGDAADSLGYFKIEGLPSETYPIEVQALGYGGFFQKIGLTADVTLQPQLEIQAIQLEAVEITPGIIEIRSEELSTHVLSSEEILSSPNFAKDVLRSIQILPSVAATDYSAKPHIKGGDHDETAILLDNMEVYDPFHLEAVSDGAASIINYEFVKNIKLATGGFSAKYPDKMSGVMEINTLDTPRDYFLRFSLDRFLTSVVLNKKITRQVNYFASARRSNFDIFPGAFSNDLNIDVGTQNQIKRRYGASDTISPLFYDFWNKLDYRLDSRHKLSFNFLFARNKLFYVNAISNFRTEFTRSVRENFYLWANWNWLINKRVYSLTTLGYQDLSRRARFTFDLNPQDGNVDRSNNGIFTLKQKNVWEIHEDHSVELGFELKRFRSDYFFDDIRLNRFSTTEQSTVFDTIFVDTELAGTTFSGYSQNTWHVSNKLHFLTGLRFSTQDYTTKAQIAPRLALKYQLDNNLDLKLAYGWYYQPENFQRFKSYLGRSELEDRPEKSIHYFGSLNYAKDRLQFNLDAYFKDYRRLSDDFEFDLYDRSDEGIPDFPFNTIKGVSRGFDAFFRASYASANLISLAYSYNKSRITNNLGMTTARARDRTHALVLNKVVKFKNGITIAGLWRYHTGDPFTPTTVQVLGDSTLFESLVYFNFGRKNSARLPAYNALDLKIEKEWRINELRIIAYLNILNVFNSSNLRQFGRGNNFRNGKLVRFIETEETFFERAFVPGLSIIF